MDRTDLQLGIRGLGEGLWNYRLGVRILGCENTGRPTLDGVSGSFVEGPGLLVRSVLGELTDEPTLRDW